jgi:hypothetical protein
MSEGEEAMDPESKGGIMTCNLCYGRGYIYHSYKEEYDVEVCSCQQTKETNNEIN